MNTQLILALLLSLAIAQSIQTTQCACTQLLSNSDCLYNRMWGCQWDSTKSACRVGTTPSTTDPTYPAYCDSFTATVCQQTLGCLWNGTKCTHFTGCTAFAKTTDQDCQAISTKCITDGTHCVEIDECSTYTKQLPCFKNTTGSLCYWDTTTNTCSDANTCEILPTSYTTDADCRKQLSQCTTKVGGGCVESGINCSDQQLEIQCVWNKAYTQGQACYWDASSTKCVDKTCDAAPSTLTTDVACKAFLTDGTCTTKSGGGCVVRGACTDAIQAACVKNSEGGDCYWNTSTSKCVDKICENAPASMTSNTACIGFAPLPANGCIAKQDGGCITNGACSTATFKDACVKNSQGQDCIWDTTCKEKTCQNAPTSNNTHDLCTSYLSSCTVKTGGGCQIRQCSNAPNSITTNEACETYLPNSNCITVANGGCTTNTTCSAISYKPACVKDVNKNACFFDDASSTCKDLICTNAPQTNTTHELCQAFSTSCTVNSTSNGCVSWTCENSQFDTICTQDINQNSCIWKAKCYKKQCALAPSTTSTHNDCYAYLPSCTLSNTGSGCVPIPLKCEAITIEAACKLRQGGSICGWNGSSCIDKACTTAPKTTTTTTDCNTYKSGCVSANPVNGSVSGCIDLPTTCAARQSLDNCSIGSSPVCLWNTTTSKCVEKTCDVASVDGTPGKITTIDATNCNSFLTGCLVSDDATKCIPKVTSCSFLHSINNCLKNSKQTTGQYCFWNGTTCVDKICTNINKTSHSACKNELDSCTVNAGLTACMTLADACSTYTIQDQCNTNSAGKFCIWTGTTCRDATCYDADIDQKCSDYKAVAQTCTSVSNGQVCTLKASNCKDYLIQAQCHKTISNTTDTDNCVWVNNGCFPVSTWATGDCSTFKGTQNACQTYRLGCSNVSGAAATTPCTFDCTRKTGSALTHQQCSSFNSTCTTSNGGANCQASNSACSGYTSNTACTYTTSGTKCYWYDNGTSGNAADDTCITITSSDCAKVTATSGLTHKTCQSYNTACTMASGTVCQAAATCSSYGTSNCTFNTTGAKCYLFTDADSVQKCIDITESSDCAKVTGTGLTNTYCQAYNSNCYVNQTGTACQLQSCGSFLTSATCLTLGTIKCYWDSTISTCIQITVANTDCQKVTGTGLTEDQCKAYNAGCTANVAATGCQEKAANCSGLASTACSVALDGKCFWSTPNGGTAACIAITNVATDCVKVSGSNLTNAQCQVYNKGCKAISDGSTCTPVTACSDYTTQNDCLNFASVKCYWYAPSGVTAACIGIRAVATDCVKVTGSNLTDDQCNNYNATCTVNFARTACQEKKSNCSEYQQSACSVASDGNCFWSTPSGGTPTCIVIVNAATDCVKITGSNLTDAQCQIYNKGCKAISGGSTCTPITACSDYKTSATCLNFGAVKCFWKEQTSECIAINSSSECVSVKRANTTDNFCKSYNSSCTANVAGTGCQQKVSLCSQYRDPTTCSVAGDGNCFWSTSTTSCIAIATAAIDCVKVTGSNLTDAQCQAYNTWCKALSDGTTCTLVTSCSDYQTAASCLNYGTVKCFWDGACIELIASSECGKITGSNISNSTCKLFHPGCTNVADKSGCQEQKPYCANYAQTACTVAQDGKCFWYTPSGGTASCVTIANPAIDCVKVTGTGLTDTLCNFYNSGCTANVAGRACQEKKPNCAAYAQTACTIANDGMCFWSAPSGGTASCIAIADVTTDCVKVKGSGLTDAQCQVYNKGCRSIIASCAQVISCGDYTSQATCLNFGAIKCYWGYDTNPWKECFAITQASDCIKMTSSSQTMTHDDCNSYNSICTVSPYKNICQEQKAHCSEYDQTSCTVAFDGNCFWSAPSGGTAACVAIANIATDCAKITGTNLRDYDCITYNQGCRTTAAATSCAPETACSDYTIQDHCWYIGQLRCSWDLPTRKCIQLRAASSECVKVTGSNLTDDQCNDYNPSCTTNAAGTACQEKLANCAQYAQIACSVASDGICFWYTPTGGTPACIAITTASTDCVKITGSKLTDDLCNDYNATCTVNVAGNACQLKKTYCSGYGQANCTVASDGNCFWSTPSGGTPACIAISNVATGCVKITGSNLTDAQCQAYNKGCKAITGGATCTPVTSCGDYKTSATCFNYGTVKCFWQASTSVCIAISNSSECVNLIPASLTKDQCNSYNASCTVNGDGSACQQKAASCSQYAEITCSQADEGQCFWFSRGDQPLCIAITRSDCDTVTGTGLTDKSCNAYNPSCTANVDGTACQQKKSNCSEYSQSACSIGGDGNCFWSNPSGGTPACIAIANANTDCVQVTGTGLTDTNCQAYNTGCKAASGGATCTPVTACGDYTTQNNCLKFASVQCYWYAPSGGSAACIAITGGSSECGKVTGTGLTDDLCNDYNDSCTANVAGTACQQKLANCAGYGEATCSFAGDGKCVWYAPSGATAACIAISTASSDCVKVTGSNLTDDQCKDYNASCIANVAGNACQEKKTNCSGYGQPACTLAGDGKCFWYSAACIAITNVASDCVKITGTNLTDAICVSYNTGCTVNSARTACQVAQAACTSYTDIFTCTYNASSVACIWYNSKCQAASGQTDCSKIIGTDLDDSACQSYNSSCKALSSTACYLVTQCSDQTTSDLCGTVGTTKCYWYNSSYCMQISSASLCTKVIGTTLTYEDCQAYNTACSVNRSGTSCIPIQAQCSSYTSPATNCVRSTAGLCASTTSSDTACQAVSLVTKCEDLYLGTGRYTDTNCNTAKAGCTNNSTTGCTARTCENYQGTPTSHIDCNNWLNTCTINTSNKCITMATTCSSQPGNATACLLATKEVCELQGTSCVKKTCDTAPSDPIRNTDSTCANYLSTCTVAKIGGCQPTAACTSYKSSSLCTINTKGESCFWNPTQSTCVDLICINIEATTSYDTHSECYAVDSTLKCTVRAKNGAAVAGCMARSACSQYTIQDQCHTNFFGGQCIWNTNLTTPACQDKSCTTAPNTIATHIDCLAYYSSTTPKVYCTVVATANPAGGLPTLAGCQQTAACDSYIAEEQCKINANGDACGWNGTVCADKSCATAQSTVNSDTLCRAYLPTCTVADSGLGCIDIPADCSALNSKDNCISNKAGDLCYWTGTACQTRTCDNAPESAASADDCNAHLTGCTIDTIKCKTQICEDFALATDALCKAALSTCTSNGTNCVKRGTCFQALNAAGCVTAAPIGTATVGKPCQWIEATDTVAGYCIEKTCETAPTATYITESQCAEYFTDCTTKSGGGCVKKSTCAAANVEAACTIAIDGTVCQWDTNVCRNQTCQDISGSSHADCQSKGIKGTCTIGKNGKCAARTTCEYTTIRAACISDLNNNPCLWYNEACYAYTSCQSQSWIDNDTCQKISPQCTTNGNNCVAITSCAETNTNGGCKTGIDGNCMQTVPALYSTADKVCKVFTACSDAYYLTHNECQIANSKCTTNGKTSCAPLDSCQTYTIKEACRVNAIGKITDTAGAVTSTGVCTWDETKSVCRDQNCSDLIGYTREDCSSLLSGCTTDGNVCLTQENCSNYGNQRKCETAYGSDGPGGRCKWDTTLTPPSCRIMACSDIFVGPITAICQASLTSCVSDGTKCIAKTTCSKYTTKTGCNSDGTDGTCMFTASPSANAADGTGTCKLMTACTDASNDQMACQNVKYRCSWTPATTTKPSVCATHTCATYQATIGSCGNFLNWAKTLQQVCQMNNGICSAVDPSTLTQDTCFSATKYAYTWSTSTSKCGVCTAPDVQQNTTNDSTIITNITNSTTTSGYILGFASVVLGYLVF